MISTAGFALAGAVSAGMASTVFVFSGTGMIIRRITLAFADEGTNGLASIGTALRFIAALAILVVALSFSALALMDRYS